MINSNTDRTFIFIFRMLMAWTFIYAASHQAFVETNGDEHRPLIGEQL